MAYLNKVMLIGNIGKDPEVRVNPNGGRKRVTFSLATSRRYRDNNGEQKEQTDWHNIVGWGKIADIVEQLGIRKGMSLSLRVARAVLLLPVALARRPATSRTVLTVCNRIVPHPTMPAWPKKMSIFRSSSRISK